MSDSANALPRIVIIGAGFGGLWAASALSQAPAQLTVIDERNYHLFQPLLYQVATAGLSPADIAAPIRGILRGSATRAWCWDAWSASIKRGASCGCAIAKFRTTG